MADEAPCTRMVSLGPKPVAVYAAEQEHSACHALPMSATVRPVPVRDIDAPPIRPATSEKFRQLADGGVERLDGGLGAAQDVRAFQHGQQQAG